MDEGKLTFRYIYYKKGCIQCVCVLVIDSKSWKVWVCVDNGERRVLVRVGGGWQPPRLKCRSSSRYLLKLVLLDGAGARIKGHVTNIMSSSTRTIGSALRHRVSQKPQTTRETWPRLLATKFKSSSEHPAPGQWEADIGLEAALGRIVNFYRISNTFSNPFLDLEDL